VPHLRFHQSAWPTYTMELGGTKGWINGRTGMRRQTGASGRQRAELPFFMPCLHAGCCVVGHIHRTHHSLHPERGKDLLPGEKAYCASTTMGRQLNLQLAAK
jgi:hypothetical protein